MPKNERRNYLEVSKDETSLYLETRLNIQDTPKAIIAGVGGSVVGAFVDGAVSGASTLK